MRLKSNDRTVTPESSKSPRLVTRARVSSASLVLLWCLNPGLSDGCVRVDTGSGSMRRSWRDGRRRLMPTDRSRARGKTKDSADLQSRSIEPTHYPFILVLAVRKTTRIPTRTFLEQQCSSVTIHNLLIYLILCRSQASTIYPSLLGLGPVSKQR